jgi:glyoxylase-like metal-dependent hydrolase (beta-lactamase superfamily II)
MGSSPASAQTTAGPVPPFFKFKVGALECTAIYDGIWEKAHDANFIKNASIDDTKQALAAAKLPTDFVSIPFTVLAVNTGKQLVLCDAGTGGQVQPRAGKFTENMKAAGLDPANVNAVLISHFHPDHIFGLMAKETNAQIFPNAEIIVSEPEFKFWTDPGVIAKLPEARQPLARRIQATFPSWKNIRRVEGEAEILPGVRTVAVPGHTAGHTAFHFASGAEQFIYSGDTFYQPAFSLPHPGWQGAFDQDGPLAEKSRRMLAERVVDQLIVTGYHFPWPAGGRLAKDGKGYTLTPLV